MPLNLGASCNGTVRYYRARARSKGELEGMLDLSDDLYFNSQKNFGVHHAEGNVESIDYVVTLCLVQKEASQSLVQTAMRIAVRSSSLFNLQ
jgi:hypothetical protein